MKVLTLLMLFASFLALVTGQDTLELTVSRVDNVVELRCRSNGGIPGNPIFETTSGTALQEDSDQTGLAGGELRVTITEHSTVLCRDNEVQSNTLRIPVFPSGPPPDEELFVFRGDTEELKCNILNPPPEDFRDLYTLNQWIRVLQGGGQQFINRMSDSINQATFALTVSVGEDIQDGDSYQCQVNIAFSSDGGGPHTASGAEIIIRIAERFTIMGNLTAAEEITVGEQVTFSCSIAGTNVSSVHWDVGDDIFTDCSNPAFCIVTSPVNETFQESMITIDTTNIGVGAVRIECGAQQELNGRVTRDNVSTPLTVEQPTPTTISSFADPTPTISTDSTSKNNDTNPIIWIVPVVAVVSLVIIFIILISCVVVVCSRSTRSAKHRIAQQPQRGGRPTEGGEQPQPQGEQHGGIGEQPRQVETQFITAAEPHMPQGENEPSDQPTAQTMVKISRWQKKGQAKVNDDKIAMERGAVAVKGSTAFFGCSENVYGFNYDENNWFSLPEVPKRSFRLVVVKDFLTAVGGFVNDVATNTLLSLDESSGKQEWTEVFPPMPTPRGRPAVVCTGHSLVAAGGSSKSSPQKFLPLDTVEVMNTESEQWFAASRLPQPVTDMMITVCDGKLFLLGGRVGDRAESDTDGRMTWVVYSSSLLQTSELSEWQELAGIPSFYSSCASICGQLLVVGGCDQTRRTPTKAVYQYDPTANAWNVVSHMLTARHLPFVAVLPNDKLLVVGGSIGAHNWIPTVEVASVSLL